MLIKKKLNELRDADVTKISLVDRSASRIPFRVLKKENTMLDLSSIARKKSDKPVIKKAEVVSIVVFDNSDAKVSEGIKESIKSAGFSIDNVVKNDDGTLSFMQSKELPENPEHVKLSNNMLLVTKGFQSAHPDLEGSDFSDAASSNNFYQGVDSSLDVLFSKICSTLQNSKDEGEASGAISKLCDGFKKYVTGLVDALPTAAFKADLSLRTSLDVVKKADIHDLKSIEDLFSKPPAGTSIAENEWGKMSTVDKIKWVLDSTSQRGAQKLDKVTVIKAEGNNAILSLQDIEKLFSTARPDSIAENDWGKMSMGDKLDWAKASYVEGGKGAPAVNTDPTKGVAKCEKCDGMKDATDAEI